MSSWIGEEEDELLRSWGLPSEVLSDGQGGRIYIYTYDLARPPTDLNRSDKDESANTLSEKTTKRSYSRRFFISPEKKVYKVSWEDG